MKSRFLASLLFAALAVPALAAPTVQGFDNETVGAEPKSFAAAVGNWVIVEDAGNKGLSVNGTKWARGQTSAGLADKARALYGERYAEFLDNVQSYAYFPIAVMNEVADFREGTITVRFKGVDGRIDQAAGILFNVQPNGDYLTLRANPLEDNLVLWQYVKGKRSSVKWIRNTPTPSGQWHELKLTVKGKQVEGWMNGKLLLTHELPKPVSGRVGLWSKADSVVYFDDYRVEPTSR
ncbi:MULTISPECIES: family 16 glycoside hydrolase [Pseudomonadota]|jgi:hypothetical protein|uniref:3-keto-alpha-glucoside-1,2-lyase/3-keto-2-hydroxy-glucal hydratase domain-containing protein n=5 Tax=Pseudomonadota TaxID=1224 RepID=F4G5I6_ALIDK|nr:MULTISPECIES: family 16 glycoside hydrolase [Pseudomonadota]MDS4010067.1 LamG domain-containing protein [Defluviicoccus sp.]AEB84162.1 hypothetical protein Alide2_1775 [Alicycliphilus denitrificans K601]MBG6817124.1 hypothetical protein [Pseudomonas aeruginosa]MBW0954921.1 hypothetical protein [Pseudomonas aeruginosa]MDA1412033.1 hypothetical protein [Pseudomonas aeruginosa]